MSTIVNDQYIRIRPRPAAFGPRIAAAIIDAIVVMTYFMGSIALIPFLPADVVQLIGPLLFVLLIFVPTIFYYPLMETFSGGRSLGKMAMGLRVVRTDGGCPDVMAYFLRWVLLFIDMGTGMACGLLCILLSRNSQRLGDMAAGTMVINEGALYASQIRMQELSFLTTQYQPVFPSSQNLTPGQVEAIRTILVSRSENRYDNLEALSQKVQKLVGPKPWAMAHEAYLTTVWRDYQAYH